MGQKTVLVTGANGAIGQALCGEFKGAGWRVIASDQDEEAAFSVDDYISIELKRFCNDFEYQKKVGSMLLMELPDNSLDALINNAAVQVIAPVEELTMEDWTSTLDVNLTAPFFLIKMLFSNLQKSKGSVINIASIHAGLTKPNFTAYATSKAALVGLTRSLAVELGSRVRVNAICPAAISTPMLKSGVDGSSQGLAKLASFHPSGCIGLPEDVAELALYLAASNNKFLNGAVIGLDGGITSRIHDPF